MKASAGELSAHLWDLRAHAEAKLRCLTRLQQLVARYERTSDAAIRAKTCRQIKTDMNDLVEIALSLRSVSRLALAAAKNLH